MQSSTRMEQQKGKEYQQLSFLETMEEEPLRHDQDWDSVTEPRPDKEQQIRAAQRRRRAITQNLMQVVCTRGNLNEAYKHVKANDGAAGTDGMTIKDMLEWLKTNKEALITSLLDGSYQPQPVKGVKIPNRGEENDSWVSQPS
jgi:RNA-directed DNA polymerase